MDFNLIDSSFHTKIPPHKPLFRKLHRIPDVLRFPEPSDSSGFQLSGSLPPPPLPLPPPPPHCNYSFAITPTNSFPVESKFPNLNNFPVLRRDSMEAMRETIFRMAVMQPIQIDPETVKPPDRKNVRISKDPQSVAARHRRERISQRIRILQRMVPGGTKLDTASMLDEAVHYLKFLKKQVQSLERTATAGNLAGDITAGFLPAAGSVNRYLRFD